jgi:hypothetical protein
MAQFARRLVNRHGARHALHGVDRVDGIAEVRALLEQ